MTIPLTIEQGLANLKVHKLNQYWAEFKRDFMIDDHDAYLNVGLFPLFLCREYKVIIRLMGIKAYHQLLLEFCKRTPPQLMILSFNHVKRSLAEEEPTSWPSNPLQHAIRHTDSKAIRIVLNHTPLRALNLKIPTQQKGEKTIDFALYQSMYFGCHKKIILKILQKTSNLNALKEAQIRGEQWQGSFRQNMSRSDIIAIKEKINKKINMIEKSKNKQPFNGCFSSLFSCIRSKKRSVTPEEDSPKNHPTIR